MNNQYPELYPSYLWLVPSVFNIADACVHRWASNTHEGRNTAVYYEDEAGRRDDWTYTRLSSTTQRLANALERMEVSPGDRVAVVMTQRPEAVASLMAILSVGAIAVPLSSHASPIALRNSLTDAEARVAIVDNICGSRVLQTQCPLLKQVVGLNFENDAIIPWRTLLARQPNEFRTLATSSRSPALLLYPTDTEHTADGVLVSHAALIGALPGFVASQNWFPQKYDTLWSPDWNAWGSLLHALLPALYFGRPLVAAPNGFSPHQAMTIMSRYQVTNAYLSTALATRIAQESELLEQHADNLSLRAIAISGPPLPEAVSNRLQEHTGLTPNLAWNQLETSTPIGDSHLKWPGRAGSLGRPYPGHRVAVIDARGTPRPAGSAGEIAVHRNDIHEHPDPSLFLGYWKKDNLTQNRYIGDWCLTGLWGLTDADGYLWLKPRKHLRARSRHSLHSLNLAAPVGANHHCAHSDGRMLHSSA